MRLTVFLKSGNQVTLSVDRDTATNTVDLVARRELVGLKSDDEDKFWAMGFAASEVEAALAVEDDVIEVRRDLIDEARPAVGMLGELIVSSANGESDFMPKGDAQALIRLLAALVPE